MKRTIEIAKLAASALVLGTTFVGCSMNGIAQRPANPSDIKAPQIAAKAAAHASKALAKRRLDRATELAEAAVAAQPRNADYRMLLGRIYLAAGRFQSAEQSFVDTLTLNPDRERAALNLALTQIALGKVTSAKSTLADYRDKLTASDFGLALALTGDTDEAVRILEFAARAPDATAKTRQNLALAYALQGKWANAKVMAVQDLSPDDAEKRVALWATFARPGGIPDQVAALLGVKPVDDAGQPSRLALAPVSTTVQTAAAEIAIPAVAQTAPRPATTAPVMPIPAPPEAAAPLNTAFETPAVVAPRPALAMAAGPARATLHPILLHKTAPSQPKSLVPASSPRVVAPMVRSAVFVRPVTDGKFLVQLGAFDNASVAQHAWNRDSDRMGLIGYLPVNGTVQRGKFNYVRLSVGGFATRSDADRVCAHIKQTGYTCFVRVKDGDAPARWVQRHTYRVAAR